jgi:hypothetical protein
MVGSAPSSSPWSSSESPHRRLRLRLALRTAVGLILIALLLSPLACATTITPPATPQNPRTVFLLDHGRHASLVLPRDGEMVRYAYGEWEWYALRRQGFLRILPTMLWPTPAGLARRELGGPPTRRLVAARIPVVIKEIYEITVSAEAVDDLLETLDGLFETNIETLFYNEVYDLQFVHHPRPYWIVRNSNNVVAGWLRDLGCEVRGPTIISNWRVRN